MRVIPINDLNRCSAKNCLAQTTVLVQRKIGDETMMFGYCAFHSIVSATFFQSSSERKEIRV